MYLIFTINIQICKELCTCNSEKYAHTKGVFRFVYKVLIHLKLKIKKKYTVFFIIIFFCKHNIRELNVKLCVICDYYIRLTKIN